MMARKAASLDHSMVAWVRELVGEAAQALEFEEESLEEVLEV